MGIDRADKIREEARAKERRIDVALTAIEVLKPDEAAFVYARLEKRILAETGAPAENVKRAPRERQSKPTPTAPAKKSAKRTTPAKKSAKRSTSVSPAKKSAKTETKKPSLSSRIEELLKASPHGLRTYEIAKAIGRKSNATGALMRFLQDQGKAQRHGRRMRTLWTVPGATPIPRIITADDAILHLLDDGPMASAQIEVEAKKLLLRATGNEVTPVSITSRFGKLLSKNLIVPHGADEHGAIYALAPEPADDADDEGGDDLTPTIN